MIPLWFFFLGQRIFQHDTIIITMPFNIIIGYIISILVPLFIGILLQIYRPKWAKILKKSFKPIGILIIIASLILGVTTHLYVIKFLSVPVVVAGCVMPCVGFIAGAIISLIFRQPWHRIKTIAIETGIQGTAVSAILLKMSLPQPDADISLISPVMVSLAGPIPLLLLVCAREIRQWLCPKSGYWCCKVDDDDYDELDGEDEDTVSGNKKDINNIPHE